MPTSWLLSEKKNDLTFWPHLGVEGVCKDKIWACMVLYAPFPLIWFATWLISENKCFDLWAHSRGPGLDQNIALFPLTWYATWLLSEKNVFTFWPYLGVECVCKDRICDCMVRYVPFHLIWYAAWLISVQKCFELLTQPQRSRVRVRT